MSKRVQRPKFDPIAILNQWNDIQDLETLLYHQKRHRKNMIRKTTSEFKNLKKMALKWQFLPSQQSYLQIPNDLKLADMKEIMDPESQPESFDAWISLSAALVIQSWWRGCMIRNHGICFVSDAKWSIESQYSESSLRLFEELDQIDNNRIVSPERKESKEGKESVPPLEECEEEKGELNEAKKNLIIQYLEKKKSQEFKDQTFENFCALKIQKIFKKHKIKEVKKEKIKQTKVLELPRIQEEPRPVSQIKPKSAVLLPAIQKTNVIAEQQRPISKIQKIYSIVEQQRPETKPQSRVSFKEVFNEDDLDIFEKVEATSETSIELENNQAAKTIQDAWFGYKQRNIFKELSKRVLQLNSANPMQVMNYLNPKELILLDNSSKSFIRFRIGGHQFPPKIYYKIYTKMPVIDMNAFSPLNYDAIKKQHSKVGKDKLEMYERKDGNGWRVFGDDSLDEQVPSPSKKYSFSKKEREAKYKEKVDQKKKEWKRIQSQSHSESEMENSDDGSDVEELTKWAETLDFEKYQKDWQQQATTSILYKNKC